MSLRHMRQQGVRSLAITCGAVWCHHCPIMDVSAFADDVVVPSPRMVCTNKQRPQGRQRTGHASRFQPEIVLWSSPVASQSNAATTVQACLSI